MYLLSRKWQFYSHKFFSFQLATGGIESVVYKKLIAPFQDDLPATLSEGLRRVCADHKYAFIAFAELDTIYFRAPCHMVPLPDTFYSYKEAFIISKISPYKRLINWRWDNKMESIRYIIENLWIFWVPCKMPKTVKSCSPIIRHQRLSCQGWNNGFVHISKVLRATGQHFKMGIDNLQLLGICD
jgi:hypothetical protein